MIVDAPWYVRNMVIRRDLQIPTVKEEIRRYSSQYSARLSAHPNHQIVNLIELPENRRLRKHLPNASVGNHINVTEPASFATAYWIKYSHQQC
jgi:hypothetical protein